MGKGPRAAPKIIPMLENKINIKPHPMVTAVASTIDGWQMLRHGDRVLVGVSGGPDSVALLHILRRLSPGMGLHIGVAHLNHSLRGSAADRDAAFVQTLARQLNLPCFSTREDVGRQRLRDGGSLEEAGRRARYRFFTRTALSEGFARIALGHHADDNAELILMNILRGAGPGGIAGIPPVREPGIVRPLIRVWRHDIMAYIKDNDLAYVEDDSNQDPRFLRNRVRHELIPALRRDYNPRVPEALVTMASISRTEEEWLTQLTDRMLKSAILIRQEKRLVLSAAYLSGLHPAATRRVVRGALKALHNGLHGISFRHVEAVTGLACKGPDPGELHLPGRLRVRRSGARLFLTREETGLRNTPPIRESAPPPLFQYAIPRPDTRTTAMVIEETGQKLLFSVVERKKLSPAAIGGQKSAFFDMDKIDFPLTLRNYRAGDSFTPLGMQGSQKVKRFFINAKIARARRRTCPVLLSRDRIIWVVGHRMGDCFKIGPSTRNVLKVELLLA